jgi:hypothetical protein
LLRHNMGITSARGVGWKGTELVQTEVANAFCGRFLIVARIAATIVACAAFAATIVVCAAFAATIVACAATMLVRRP